MTQHRKLIPTTAVSAAMILGLAFAAAGCSGGAPSPTGQAARAGENPGDVSLALQLGSGATITSASYTIIGPASFSKSGSIDVSQSTKISATIAGLPAGTGYSVTLSASTADSSVSCNGSASFAVTAHQTTPVTVAVSCRETAKNGSVLVNGVLNICPVADGITANPSSLNVGGSTVLTGVAHDTDSAPSALSYQWTASSGSLSSATDPTPTFTCTAAGTAKLTLTVSDGDTTAGCGDTLTTDITCSAPVCPAGCDDGNPCTTDACSPTSSCTHSTVADGTLCQGGNLKVKLLGFNDFHGQISAGKLVSGRPVGSAGVLSAYLKSAQAGIENQTLIVHAGDHVGASPASSALLQDEPSIQWLNMLANSSCTYGDKLNSACNIVGTLGNHEFDEGKTELLRLLNGGNHISGPFLEDPYKGARFPYVSANVVDEVTNRPILPPYVIKRVQGVPIAFVGAVLEATPTIVTPTGVAGLKFLDEADAANSYVPEIKALGVKTIVLLIHQGTSMSSYTTATNTALTNSAINGSDILDVVTRLDSEFDVVVSGHSHSFTNLLVTNNGGKKILLTQAFSASTAYDDIDLTIDPVTKDVVTKSAKIVTTFADVAPGNAPDPAAVALTSAAEARVAPLVTQVVGFTAVSLTRDGGSSGEQLLGDVIADSQNLAEGTQFAFMNPGGIRADLVVPAGGANITWNDLFTIQPFGNTLVKMNLTGAQIKALLEQQWLPGSTRILQISGLGYTWDAALPIGGRIVEVHDAAGVALDPVASYSITCNNFLATGGDSFTVFTGGTNAVGGPVDLDAMIEYTEHHNPLPIPVKNRITRLH
ncbi:MAG: 5'-nucleotidase C-terminal domain-containing protein [Polyangiaceae bacterium]